MQEAGSDRKKISQREARLDPDPISTWEDLNEEEAEGYKEQFHQGKDGDPAAKIDEAELREAFSDLFQKLTPMQSMVLRLRFGIAGVAPMTVGQITNCFANSDAVRARISLLDKMGGKISSRTPKDTLFDSAVSFLLGKSDRAFEFDAHTVGRLLGVSHQAVVQAEQRALQRMRYTSERAGLGHFLDAVDHRKEPISRDKVDKT